MRYHIIPVTPFHQNCSLIWCELTNEAILVDPGGETEKLYQEIYKLKLKISQIWLTHGHIDHVGSAMELKKCYNIPIIGPHKEDALLLKNLTLQCATFNIKAPIYPAITPDRWLKDGDVLQVGNEIFNVLYCPGHSPGHVVFWNKAKKFIIVGDVLFRHSIGRTDLPGGDFTKLINSIKIKLLPLEDDIFFIPGHGITSTIGYTRKILNNFL